MLIWKKFRHPRAHKIMNLQNHLDQNVRHRQQNIRNIIVEEADDDNKDQDVQRIIQYRYKLIISHSELTFFHN